MEYHFLHQWVSEHREQNLVFQSFKKYEDQFFLQFSKQKEVLQINFSSENSFPFFISKNDIVKESQEDYAQMNTLLTKARFKEISISNKDRIITLHFEKIDIYNEKIKFKLILEVVPRYQNWILVKDNGSEKHIVECWKKVSLMDNRHRQVLPGLNYQEPPTDFIPNKVDIRFPYSIEGKRFKMDTAGFYHDMNTAFSALFYDVILENRIAKIKNQKIKSLKKKIKSKEKKIVKMQNDLLSEEDQILFKQYAELLNGYFSNIKKGMESINVIDYYNEPYKEISIALNPTKTPAQNIAYYAKKYRKARDGREITAQIVAKTREEIDEIEQHIFDIEDLDSYIECRLLQQEKKNIQKKNKKTLKRIKVNEAWEILVGRTSRENDYLTTRVAKKYDWWFHTRVFQGTHVILRNFKKQELPDDLCVLCCRIAAYFSRAKKSSNVPVDFTQVRFVRKPRGAAPGYVIYTDQKTLYVDPLRFRDAANYINKTFQVD